MFNIGILGTGGIAHKMADTVAKMENVQVIAVGSRDINKAREFAGEFNIEKSFGSYEEFAACKEIDLVYVASPHSHHYEHCLLCLENGKNILCEKAFAVNAVQAAEILEIAAEKKLFVGEAMWTRYVPMRAKLDELLASGIIGEISAVTANLGYMISHVERLIKPELAGGALLDLGVYTLNFASMVLGNDISDIKSCCVKNEYGVDLNNSIMLSYKNGATALLHSNAQTMTDRRGIIYGSEGRIEVENINNPEAISVFKADGTYMQFDAPEQITGFEYQVQAAIDSIKAGKIEAEQMPHSEILCIMKIMDSLRAEWGIKYPFE